jgi:hypothetical protein
MWSVSTQASSSSPSPSRSATAGEVDAWAQELGRRGFALVAPPSGDRWEGTRSFRLADPDGRQVAVFYDYPR